MILKYVDKKNLENIVKTLSKITNNYIDSTVVQKIRFFKY